jgi:elongation factor G
VLNSSRGSTERISQLFRMHAHKRERIPSASAGEIVAALGLRDALTGDTVCDPGAPVLLQSMNVPEPVVSLAVEPRGAEDREKLLPALEKLQWEDPTFRVREDQETGQTILTGMGELHLEIIIDRLRRDFGVGVKTGVPKVVYRETVQSRVERREKFHRELDGKVQEGELLLRVAPAPRGSGISILVPEPEETTLPAEMLQAVKETLCLACSAGCRTGYPLTDVVVEVVEAPFLPGQTTETGLRAAAFRCMSESAASALLLLEPVMALEITTPQEFGGKVLGSLQQKRSRVEGIETDDDRQLIRAQVPLVEMFGYMTELRSATKGHGTFTMEFSRFEAAPSGALAQFGL